MNISDQTICSKYEMQWIESGGINKSSANNCADQVSNDGVGDRVHVHV